MVTGASHGFYWQMRLSALNNICPHKGKNAGLGERPDLDFILVLQPSNYENLSMLHDFPVFVSPSVICVVRGCGRGGDGGPIKSQMPVRIRLMGKMNE